MKRSELLFEVAFQGEVLLEPFQYANGRLGYMVIDDKKRSFNLTVNLLDEKFDKTKNPGHMYLKMWDDVEHICRHLLDKTDMFKKTGIKNVGINFTQSVELNPDYYVET